MLLDRPVDIEDASNRTLVRRSLTEEEAAHFLRKQSDPNRYVLARGGLKLWSGEEYLKLRQKRERAGQRQ